jgi:hypothetical protein
VAKTCTGLSILRTRAATVRARLLLDPAGPRTRVALPDALDHVGIADDLEQESLLVEEGDDEARSPDEAVEVLHEGPADLDELGVMRFQEIAQGLRVQDGVDPRRVGVTLDSWQAPPRLVDDVGARRAGCRAAGC